MINNNERLHRQSIEKRVGKFNNSTPNKKIYDALTCESLGAMWGQRLAINNGEIEYVAASLDLQEFMPEWCHEIPSMHKLLEDQSIRQEIFNVAKTKEPNKPNFKTVHTFEPGTVILDNTDFHEKSSKKMCEFNTRFNY